MVHTQPRLIRRRHQDGANTLLDFTAPDIRHREAPVGDAHAFQDIGGQFAAIGHGQGLAQQVIGNACRHSQPADLKMIEARQRFGVVQRGVDVYIMAERALGNLRARLQPYRARPQLGARSAPAEMTGRVVQHEVELLLADNDGAWTAVIGPARVVLGDDAFRVLDVLRCQLNAAHDRRRILKAQPDRGDRQDREREERQQEYAREKLHCVAQRGKVSL